MSKLEESLSRFFGGDDCCGFNSGMLIVIAIVYFLLATNIFDDFFDDDCIWIWIILIIYSLIFMKDKTKPLGFGPFIAIASYFCLFYGSSLLNWYFHLF